MRQMMKIKVLGPGCQKCYSLEKAVKNTLAELDLEADVSKVDDIMDIMEYGVISTPALVINEKTIFSGRIPSDKELKKIILQNK